MAVTAVSLTADKTTAALFVLINKHHNSSAVVWGVQHNQPLLVWSEAHVQLFAFVAYLCGGVLFVHRHVQRLTGRSSSTCVLAAALPG